MQSPILSDLYTRICDVLWATSLIAVLLVLWPIDVFLLWLERKGLQPLTFVFYTGVWGMIAALLINWMFH